MRILITGANGFIGKNLDVRLRESREHEIFHLNRGMDIDEVFASLGGKLDAVVHLAGVNRPRVEKEFHQGNVEFTLTLCQRLKSLGYPVHVIFSSSIQAGFDNPYGISKQHAEKVLSEFSSDTASAVHVFRLPNVFGKWCKPEYNSVVATFCHNIANSLEIRIDDPSKIIQLVYVDDVVDCILDTLNSVQTGFNNVDIGVSYNITLESLSEQLYRFRDSRESLLIDDVGIGLTRALYATYLSYLAPENFSYPLKAHTDNRGSFVEFLKTRDSGQISFLTAGPGITRGCHYHHTKNEKFLVVQGSALFRYRHIITGDTREIMTNAEERVVVETIPGWVHEITNCGNGELVVLLWANEIFDRDKPDTIGASIYD